MIGRRKNPQNLWLLLVVPAVGIAGWVARRWLRRKATPEAAFHPLEVRSSGEAAVSAGSAGMSALDDNRLHQETEPPVPAAGHALRHKPEKWLTFLILLIPFLILPVAIVGLAFRHIPVQSQPVVPNGDANQGQVLLAAWGCGSCHTISGVTGATGKVGPALDRLSDRSYIAGHLQNTPENMIQWIMHPQQVSPGVDMPDSNVPEGVARDMAAYLYSLH